MRNTCCGTFSNTITIFNKTLKIIARNKVYFLIFLLSPLFSVLFVNFYENKLRSVERSQTIRNPPEVPIQKLSKCKYPQDCTTLGYYVIGGFEDWINPVMEKVAQMNDLVFSKDVRLLGTGSPESFKKYALSNRNQTQASVIFCTDTWNITIPKLNRTIDNNLERFEGEISSINIPCKFEKLEGKKLIFYNLIYNSSIDFRSPYFTDDTNAFPIDMIAVQTKRAIDEALISYFGTQPGSKNVISEDFRLDYYKQDYPKVPLRFKKNASFVVNLGSFFFYIPIAVK